MKWCPQFCGLFFAAFGSRLPKRLLEGEGTLGGVLEQRELRRVGSTGNGLNI